MLCLLIPEFICTMCISWTPSTTSIETKAKMVTGAKAETKARASTRFKPKTKAQAQLKPKSEGMAQGKGPTKAKAGDNPHVVAMSNSWRSSTTSIKTKATMVAEAKVETTSSAGAKFKPGTRPQAGSLPPPCCCASWPHLATPGWAWGGGLGGSRQHIWLNMIPTIPTSATEQFLVENTFSGQNLCSEVFVANTRYTKQRARHEAHLSNTPRPPFGGRPCPALEQSSGRPVRVWCLGI